MLGGRGGDQAGGGIDSARNSFELSLRKHMKRILHVGVACIVNLPRNSGDQVAAHQEISLALCYCKVRNKVLQTISAEGNIPNHSSLEIYTAQYLDKFYLDCMQDLENRLNSCSIATEISQYSNDSQALVVLSQIQFLEIYSYTNYRFVMEGDLPSGVEYNSESIAHAVLYKVMCLANRVADVFPYSAREVLSACNDSICYVTHKLLLRLIRLLCELRR